MLLSISPSHLYSTRSVHPTVSAGMRTLSPYLSDATVFSSVVVDRISGAALAFLTARCCSAVHPRISASMAYSSPARCSASVVMLFGALACKSWIFLGVYAIHVASVILPDSYNAR